MGTKVNSNYEDLLTFTRASKGHALRPVSYGDELVTNGTFDSDITGWSSSVYALSLSSNALKIAYDGQTYGNFSGSIGALEAGKLYQLTYKVVSASQASSFKLVTADSALLNKTAGTHTFAWVQTSNTSSLTFYMDGIISGESITLDNISVKEVTFDQTDGTLTLFEHPNNVPRVEWDADRNRLGLLVEESRTNLITDSAGASSDDAKSGSSQTSGQTNSLTGLDDAFLVQATNTGTSFRGQRISVTSGTSYAASRFIKAGTTNFAQISMGTDGFGTNVYANFDLSNGTVATESNCDASITEMGGGWYRCSITKAATNTTSGTSPNYFTPVASGTSTIRTAVSGDNVYQFGAQTEAGSFPTSYIKTTGSTASRSADVASVPVANFGLNGSSYSMLLEAISSAPDNAAGTGNNANSITQLKTSTSNYSSLGIGSTSTRVNRPSLASRNNAGSTVGAGDVASLDNTFDEGLLVKFSASFDVDSGTIAGSVNGSTVFSSTGSVAGVDLPFTDLEFNNGQGAAYIKSIQYYPRRLTNAQLEALTEPRSTPTLSLTFDGLESSYTENYIHG